MVAVAGAAETMELWDRRHTETRRLSGGLKRRLMIARALVHRPQLLILDEPTAGVDIEIRRSMWHYLCELNQEGTTIILTTHYLDEAESLCRNIAIIDQGQIIRQSTMRALLDQLHTETFVLNLRHPLALAPDIPGLRLRLSDPSTLEVEVDRQRNINGLFASLAVRGIEVMSMRNKQNRLEQLFLNLVEKRQDAEQ